MTQDDQTLPSSSLANPDLLPARQTWSWYNIFAFWMSDVHSAGGYVFAGTLFSLGLAGWQVFASLLFGILIVQVLANWIGEPSRRHAVPFPVVARMTFGVYGSNLPALIRGVIAVVWYGIQTYLASAALMVVVLYFFPEWLVYTESDFLGLSCLGWWCFLTMWCAQTALFIADMKAIRVFIDWAGPAVYIVMLIMMGWIVMEAGWENISFTLSERTMSPLESLWAMIVGISLIVSYFAGPTLNFGDFSRYCRSDHDMHRGNFWGLPVNFVFFSSIAVITISGTPVVFGELIMDPIQLMGKLDSKSITLLLGFTLLVATVGVNVVANFVSAAFDISNLAPSKLSWRRGGFIASILAVLMLPWHLFHSPEVIHHTIDVLAGFIGPVYGVIIVDYYRIKMRHIVVRDLYDDSPSGTYWYVKGWNLHAVWALLAGGMLSILLNFIPGFTVLSNFSFFFGALLSGAVYARLAQPVSALK